jgi:hypothetical protein
LTSVEFPPPAATLIILLNLIWAAFALLL